MSSGYSQVTAANFKDSTGTPIADATVYFQPCTVPGGMPIAYASGGDDAGQRSSTPVSTACAAGVLSIQLANTTMTSPVNIGYQVSAIDNVSGKQLLGPGYIIQPNAAEWSFDSFNPNLSPQMTVAMGPQGPQGTAGTNGTDGATTPNFTSAITVPGASIGGAAGIGMFVMPTEEGYFQFYGDRFGKVYFGLNASLEFVGPSGLEAFSALTTLLVLDGNDVAFPGAVSAQSLSSPNILPVGPAENGAAFSVLDASYRVIHQIDANGNRIENCVLATLATLPSAAPVPDPSAFAAVYNHLTETGQSLSTGDNAFPILSTSAPFTTNKKLGISVNAVTAGVSGITLEDLCEEQATTGWAAEGGETIGTSCGANIATKADNLLLPHPIIFSGSGWSGQPYSAICGPTDWVGQTIGATAYPTLVDGVNLGSPSFQELMSQIATAKSLTGAGYAHRAVCLVHGEADGYGAGNADYGANLVTWQRDIQNGSTAITGRAATVPMLMSQCIFGATSGLRQLATCLANPLTHTMVGPEYNIPHQSPAEIAAGANSLHLSAAGQRILGAYFAKAYVRRMLYGQPFTPLCPARASLALNVLTIHYAVPVAPIVLDTSLVSDPGNSGFVWSDATVGTTIGSVAVGADGMSIVITLSGVPNGAPGQRTIAYAATNPSGSDPLGPLYGPRGCVRDSDPALSYYAETNPVSDATTVTAAKIALFNYSVAFSITF